MTEMVERVAQAIWDSYRQNDPEVSETIRGSSWATLLAAAAILGRIVALEQRRDGPNRLP